MKIEEFNIPVPWGHIAGEFEFVTYVKSAVSAVASLLSFQLPSSFYKNSGVSECKVEYLMEHKRHLRVEELKRFYEFLHIISLCFLANDFFHIIAC